jgi:hypothetical protein
MTDPSIAAPVQLPGELRIGGIFSRAFNILSQNFMPFVLLTALATFPNLILGGLGASARIHPGWVGLSWLLGIIFSFLAQGFVLYAAFQDMLNRHVRAGESLGVASARFFPIVGVAICVGIAGGFGMLLLVVPGIIWLVMWSVAVPACVVERLGPIQSMRRSAALTKGHRWKIFGIFVLLLVVNLICQIVLRLVLKAAGGVDANIVGLWIWSAIFTAFSAIVTTIIYHDLRVAKEGVDTEQIAAVFA